MRDPPATGVDKVAATGHLAPLLGACILSSVGSLPLHLAPLIIATLVLDARMSVADAGLVPSSLLLGQLSSSLALPLLAARGIGRRAALGAGIVLLLGLGVATFHDVLAALLGWFVVGLCCGAMMYLGAIAASRYPRPTFAFTLRLAIVLLLAGAIFTALELLGATTSFLLLAGELSLMFALVYAVGLLLYRPAAPETSPAAAKRASWSARQVIGLATLYFLFVGQTGFLAYVMQHALSRGMRLSDALWSLAAMKVIAGAWLMTVSYFELRRREGGSFLYRSLLLALAAPAVFYSPGIAVFLPCLIVFEIAFNSLSARLQGAVTATAPEFAGKWLTAVILLGAATGPPLNGLAIGSGHGDMFIALTIVSAVAPMAWHRWAIAGTPARN